VSDVVRAAGGVILRRRGGALETLVVHRPKYDDLTFPKGKALDGETDQETALREVAEETGLRCALGPELVSTAYRDPQGRPKEVRYWLLKPDGTESAFVADDEIDRVAWVDVGAAGGSLTYERDHAVLDAAIGLAQPIYLVRHAKAGSRQRGRRDDDLRPLSGKGIRQAEGIDAALADRPIASVLSSPATRCIQTVEPLARRHGLEVRLVPWLAVDASPEDVRREVLGLAGPAVLSTHGEVIPPLVGGLTDDGLPTVGPMAWKKGSTWVLERDDGFPSRLQYVPPPRDRAPRPDR
jgi:8-oxo-dGTP pyrophosphatase MutT (NUDIX family)/phosphohistidine phosphatase SixA